MRGTTFKDSVCSDPFCGLPICFMLVFFHGTHTIQVGKQNCSHVLMMVVLHCLCFFKMASVKAANYYQTNKQKKYNNKNTQTSLDDFISEA